MIAIKGMKEMPNACLECDLCIDYGSYGKCKCNNFEVDTTKFSRHKDCPLVEIVTCKDCNHRIGCKCALLNLLVDDSGFCANGERRE